MELNVSETLRKQLTTKQKQVDLILAIDQIRDTLPEPHDMMVALSTTLAAQIQTDLCLICLRDRETGHFTATAMNLPESPENRLTRAKLRDIDRHTRQLQEICLWEGDTIPSCFRMAYPVNGLHAAVIPILLHGQNLGIILFVRSGNPFSQDDLTLITIAESQVDSAVMQCAEYHTLQQRNKELETIYRIDKLRDQHRPFDEMLSAVLTELRHVIQAEAGFIMLYNKLNNQLDLRTASDNYMFLIAPHYDRIEQIAKESLAQAEMVWYNDLGTDLESIICIPLILENEIIGVLGVVNRYGRYGFDAEDRRLLHAI
ncbi:GAF domain-containing protein, partial [candidate division KSB3 bacterium]|nr:GAF domain-containing protein [candidate division KSB3 bacterium]